MEKVKNLKEFYLQHVAAVAEAAVVVVAAAAVAAAVVVADAAAAAVVDATEFAAVLNPKVSNQKDGASEN